MKAMLPNPLLDQARLQNSVFDHFNYFASGHQWTDTSGDTGASVAGSDARGGVAVITTGATDNNEAYLLSTQEIFLISASKPIYAEAAVQFTEANTDDANVMFGLMNAVGANSIVDDGAGPKASFSGAVIYKVDGGTTWKFTTSIGTTNTTSATNTTAGGSAYQRLAISIEPISSTVALAIPFVDGQQLIDTSGNLIAHQITFASATEMNLFVGAKAGGANSEVVNVDWLGGVQKV
jgi:hypothetical protein